MKKNPEQTTRTKQKLKDAFWELYSTRNKVTVDSVSKAAGYNRCTFYRYYTDVDAVLLEIEQELCTSITQIVHKHISSEHTNSFVEDIASFYETESDKILFLLGKYGSPRFSHMMKEQMAPLISRRFPHIDQTYHKIITGFLFGALTSSLSEWYQSGKIIPLQELIDTVSSIVTVGISGLCTPPVAE